VPSSAAAGTALRLPKVVADAVSRYRLAPYLLVAAVAFGAAYPDGTASRGTGIVLASSAAAAVVAGGPSVWRPRSVGPVGAAVIALCVWLVVDGVLRTGLHDAVFRVPLLVLLVAVTARAVSHLAAPQREVIFRGLVVLGAIHAALAVTQTVVALVVRGPEAVGRADGLMPGPNALGVLLAATGALTARELERDRRPWQLAALVVQVAALLLTASRTALLAALAVLAWACFSRLGRGGRLLVLPWAVLALTVVAWRSAGAPPERWYLWQAAIDEIGDHPIVGRGPAPQVFETGLPSARPTTHAHNELLQLAVEYGLVGLGLTVLAAVLAVRATACRRGHGHDGWVIAATVPLLAGGGTDYSLRVPALTLVAAILGAAALRPPTRAASPGTTEARQVGSGFSRTGSRSSLSGSLGSGSPQPGSPAGSGSSGV
jgi:hypothetical protein